MHLGNGAITPGCFIATSTLALSGWTALSLLARRTHPTQPPPTLSRTAALSAFLFAAQLLNWPLLPFSSVHLVGGVLLAWCLGPVLGSSAMALILVVQSLLLGDGGLAALGANLINMALLPAGLVVLFRSRLMQATPWIKRIGLGLLSWFAILLASLAIPFELLLFRSQPLPGWGSFTSQLIGLHTVAGVFEGLLTMGLIWLWEDQKAWVTGALGVGSVVLVGLATVIPSALPDSYEAVLRVSGLGELLGPPQGLILWLTQVQSSWLTVLPLSRSLSEMLGTLLVGMLVWVAASEIKRSSRLPGPR